MDSSERRHRVQGGLTNLEDHPAAALARGKKGTLAEAADPGRAERQKIVRLAAPSYTRCRMTGRNRREVATTTVGDLPAASEQRGIGHSALRAAALAKKHSFAAQLPMRELAESSLPHSGALTDSARAEQDRTRRIASSDRTPAPLLVPQWPKFPAEPDWRRSDSLAEMAEVAARSEGTAMHTEGSVVQHRAGAVPQRAWADLRS